MIARTALALAYVATLLLLLAGWRWLKVPARVALATAAGALASLLLS